MTPEIFARLAPLPAKVKAVVITDDYMTFTIFVSEYLCESSRMRALRHELRHIYEDHFTNEVIPIAQLERLANQIGKRPPRLLPLDGLTDSTIL